MILEFVMNLLKVFLLAVIGLFPTLPSMDWLIDGIDPVFEVIGLVDHVVSIRTLALCFGVLLVVSNIQFVWGIIMWVIRKIPGVS